MAGIFPDLVFEKRLLAGKDHANDAGLQRLFEFADELVSIRAGIPGGNEKFTGLIQEPDGAFVGAGFGEAMFDGLAQQRIEERTELLGLNACGNTFEPLREDGLQLRKSWIGKYI